MKGHYLNILEKCLKSVAMVTVYSSQTIIMVIYLCFLLRWVIIPKMKMIHETVLIVQQEIYIFMIG